MSRPPTTIVHVASAAGVAVSTVSRVLNGGSASAKATENVQRAIASLGFTRSAAARNLKLGRTGIVGIAGASSSAPWFTALLTGMEGVLAEHNASIAISSWQRGNVYDLGPIESWVSERRIDHLVLVRPGLREKKLATAALKAGISVVALLSDFPVPGDLIVRADNRAGGQLAAAHLLKFGHKQLVFLGGPADSIDTQDRLLGVKDELARSGLTLPKSRILFAPSYEAVAGARLAHIWQKSSALRRTTAVVLGNDALALGFMRTLLAGGISIPGDVSVIGFDGIAAGELVWPGLTTVAQPTARMGADIARHLLDPLGPQGRVLTYFLQLITRESTGPCPKSSALWPSRKPTP